MKRTSVWLSAACVLGTSLLLGTPAHACKCMFPPVEAARDDATAVFEGRVLAVEASPSATPVNSERQVTLTVVRTWKGLEQDEHISVFTNGSSASCGYTFNKDASYLIYARTSDDGKLHVNSCSRTKSVADSAEDLAFLGAGSTPVHVEPKAIAQAADTGASKDLPPPVPAASTPTAAVPKKKGCSIAQADQPSSQAWLFALPALALVMRRRAKKSRELA
jgi:hypothetical protein